MRTSTLPSSTALGRRPHGRLGSGAIGALAALALLTACGVTPATPSDESVTTPEVAAEAEPTEQNVAESSAPEAAAPTESTSESVEPSPDEETETAPQPEPIEPQSFSGSGSDVVMLEPLGDGVFYATVTHDGSSNIALWSVDENGQNIDLLVNEIGTYEGDVALNFGEDPAALRVEADGGWTIDLVPLREAPRWDGSSAFEGHGGTILIVEGVADGLTPVALTHDGESNFAIWAWGEGRPDLIVNEIGAYDGTTLLPDGSLVLQITADGGWSISTD
ncbi:hypothetical protein V1260_11350 [Brachybacterium sp. J144]|uniref:hypothetical protein n=1 Tax=Brachybacterium sp. J144 TaxID=3116487 RepID=UPI002E78836A|nr:hypothetical protein [Brachybacterium sp. J144]MEE1651377.1 hypothetical protein [Brachybacterium sp. J144]